MSSVGIIANPFSSMDIRRLVAYASTMGSYHKIGIVRRVLAALNWVGVDEILIMPDRDNLGRRAMADIRRHELRCRVSVMDIPITNEAEDSVRAARLMREQSVDCIVTIGGDGTNRVVARTCGRVPIMPISTGTNNTFPFMVEGTTAGLAAGIIAQGIVNQDRCVAATKKLNIIKNGRVVDLALIDTVVLDQQFLGADPVMVRKAVLRLALEHRIVSRYTSLVAVEQVPLRPVHLDLRTQRFANLKPAGTVQTIGMPATATASRLNLWLGASLLLAALLIESLMRFASRQKTLA